MPQIHCRPDRDKEVPKGELTNKKYVKRKKKEVVNEIT